MAVPPPRIRFVLAADADAQGAEALLAGMNVLLVEDEASIALSVQTLIDESACNVLGPYADVKTAGTAIKTIQRIDCAILDINLGNEHSLWLADALSAKSIPYIWVSGHEKDILPPSYRDQPFVSKPFSSQDLLDALTKALGGQR